MENGMDYEKKGGGGVNATHRTTETIFPGTVFLASPPEREKFIQGAPAIAFVQSKFSYTVVALKKI